MVGEGKGGVAGGFLSGVRTCGTRAVKWDSAYTENHRVLHLKRLNFMVCELCFLKNCLSSPLPQVLRPRVWRCVGVTCVSCLQTPHRHGAQGEADAPLRDVRVRGPVPRGPPGERLPHRRTVPACHRTCTFVVRKPVFMGTGLPSRSVRTAPLAPLPPSHPVRQRAQEGLVSPLPTGADLFYFLE